MHSIQSYPRNAREAAVLLNGIGTGTVPAGARGESRDWEIFDWPDRGNYLPFASLALRAPGHQVPPVARILDSELAGDSGEPYALKSLGETLVRREYRLPRSLADVNVSWIAWRS